jgi:hypothetical protein
MTVGAIVVMASTVSAQTARRDAPKGTTRTWSPARTPDGQPDLQGVWSDTAVTPLERPRALEGRQFLTEQEVNRLRARADRLFNNATSDFVAGDNLFLALLSEVDAVDNPNATGSALNMVWREFDNRTSLITDPADGRLPALTPEGRARQVANQVASSRSHGSSARARRRAPVRCVFPRARRI